MSAKYSNNRSYRDEHSAEILEETVKTKAKRIKKEKLNIFKQFIKKFFNK